MRYRYNGNMVDIRDIGLEGESVAYEVSINGIKMGQTFSYGNMHKGHATLYYLVDKKECVDSKIYYNKDAKSLIRWITEYFFMMIKFNNKENDFIKKSQENGYEAFI